MPAPDHASSRAARYGVLAAGSSIEHEIEIKRSRFICYLERVESEPEAREVVSLVRQEHRLARHHCSAFVLGPDRDAQRSNDDGEPSGTAGVPMLEALTLRERLDERGEALVDLSDVVAVVVRYFGGVLLGAGGLVRAYSDAVSRALDEAELVTRARLRVLELDAPHAAAGRWENEIRAAGYETLPSSYEADSVRLALAIPDAADDRRRADAYAAALTQGAVVLRDAGVRWVDLESPR